MNIVLIHSGGLDSSVLLGKLVEEGNKVKCLSVDYGQRHARELVAASAVMDHYKVKPFDRFRADLSALKPILGGSSQTDDSVPVPHGHYAAENMKLTVVANRNMLMLAVAGAWAISSKADAVAYGAHAGDHAIYPDCREEFVEPLSRALANADWHKVQIVRPFLHFTKAEIVNLGFGLEVPMGLTYSCYEGRPDHCGLCGTCQERRAAFRDAGVPDPTTYEAEGLAKLPTEALAS